MKRKKLIYFRKSQDKTKRQMATLLGISESYYEKIEYGVRNPSYNFIKKFKIKFPQADVEQLFFTRRLKREEI